MRFYILGLIFLLPIIILGQQTSHISGRIVDIDNYPIELVNISVENAKTGTTSNYAGKYKINIPANKLATITYSIIGYKTQKIKIQLEPNENKRIDIKLLETSERLQEIEISEERERHTTIYFINPKTINQLPQVNGSIESIIKTMPGVSSNNELSNQYSVRGGSYDENLIYVNGVEIYRPFLVRSGQQEGFSFLNPDMVSSISFSAGGFEAKYGDKMSSVLDIQYKEPTKWGGAFSGGLMGGNVTIYGSSPNHRLTQITSVRYKKPGYILNTLETSGDYKPSFSDMQTYLTYDLSEHLEIGFLGNYSKNNYNFIPSSRETIFGLVNNSVSFKTYFEGQEQDKFITQQMAFLVNYTPNKKVNINISASSFQSDESETYDILGEYWLNQVDSNLGSSTFGDSVGSLAVGSYLDHARNYLKSTILNLAIKGSYKTNYNNIVWGAKIQSEKIHDKINDWLMLDSAGYSLPPDSTNHDLFNDSIVSMYESTRYSNNINSTRFTSFIQDTWQKTIDSTNIYVTGGLRFNYWSFNNEYFISPRLSFAIQPNWKQDWLFRLSGGSYFQPAFYKETINTKGALNKNIKAQESYHIVLGADHNFTAWRRQFKFVTEVYYKSLKKLIPYSVDNVRIIYEGDNISSGYATGLDLKLTGEFVKGVDSWVSISLLNSKEDIKNDVSKITNQDGTILTTYPGYVYRPSAQTVTINLFFQDYLPGNPTIKMHMNLVYGSGLHYGPPNSPRYLATARMPSYRRVDMGISKSLISPDRPSAYKPKILNWINDLWIGVEAFNLFDIRNTISYTWVKDIYGAEYAVPNFLTGRLFNIKISSHF